MRIRVKPSGRRPRGAVGVAASIPLLALLVVLIVGPQKGGSAVSLAVGLFPALLTAFTLVIVLTMDVDSHWPALEDVIHATLLRWWFMLSMVGVVVAAYFDQRGRSEWTTVAINIALAAGILGSISLYRLLRISSGRGRLEFLADLLARAVQEAHPAEIAHGRLTADASDHVAFGAFLSQLEVAGDTGNVAAFRERLDELEEAGGLVSPPSVQTLLALDLKVLAYLSQAVLQRRADSPEVGKTLVPRLGRLIVDHSGVLLTQDEVPGRGIGVQLQAAVYIGQAARLLAWMAGAALAEARALGEPPLSLRALASGAVAARQMLITAVDPDPPDHFLPETHPWRTGLADPEAALTLWWCICDLNGAHDGLAAYAMYEILAGQKFYGTYGFGNRYIATELRSGLARQAPPAFPAERVALSDPAFARFGGFETVLVELLAVNLSCWRDRRAPIPDGFEQNWTVWDDPRRMARRARLFLPAPDEQWLTTVEEALTMLARLIGGGRSSSSLGGYVEACLETLPVNAFPRVWSTDHRPAAAVLAIALHLAPRSPIGSPKLLFNYLERVPDALLDGALKLAEEILFLAGSDAKPAQERVLRLAQLVQFLQHDPQPEDA